jgi:hypothetical protein
MENIPGLTVKRYYFPERRSFGLKMPWPGFTKPHSRKREIE